ncbi:MAG: hypothetical protein PUC65_07290 [Clostridiales bacterium]|nr:hypothetical protein [Clostridiales bacterium]
MGDPRYSYMKPSKKEEKKPAKKKPNILGIVFTVFGIVNLIILILSIIVKESGNKILFWSIATALCAGVAVVMFVCGNDE